MMPPFHKKTKDHEQNRNHRTHHKTHDKHIQKQKNHTRTNQTYTRALFTKREQTHKHHKNRDEINPTKRIIPKNTCEHFIKRLRISSTSILIIDHNSMREITKNHMINNENNTIPIITTHTIRITETVT